MSEDSQESDSTNQASDPHQVPTAGIAGANDSSDNTTTDSNISDSNTSDGATSNSVTSNSAASAIDSNTQPDFEPVTIRAYLTEQFGVRQVSTPDQHAAPVASPTDANAELAKWRERVPKLASALREKKAQVNLLETELARLQAEASTAPGPGAGLKVRDEHIAALELKLANLTTSYQNSEGSLRARELELDDLRSDLQASKQRWQSLTEALDEQVASTDQAQAQLQAATDREAVLQEKFDTQQLELAAKDGSVLEAEQALANQVAAGSAWAEQLKDQAEILVDAQAQLQSARDRELELQEKLETQQLELAAKDGSVQDAERALAEQVAAGSALAEQLRDQTETLAEAQEQLAGLDERNEKLLETTELANRQLISLSEDLSRLQAEAVSKDQELVTQLAKQKQLGLLDTAQIQAEHSERLRDIHAQTLLVFEAVERQNLEERRSSVAAMQDSLAAEFSAQEQQMQCDYVELQQAASGLMQQVSRLQNQVACEQQAGVQASAEFANAKQIAANEHRHALREVTVALEAQLQAMEQQQQQQQEQQRQEQQLLSQQAEEQPRIVMLGEISDANEGRSEFEQAWRDLDDPAADATNETIRELQRLLEIRNEELSAALAAQVHFLPAASPTSLLSPNLATDGEPLESATKETSASDSVATLQAQIYSARTENERLRQQLERTSAALLASDDLTQLKGVGGKLAEQLRDLGISQFAQMAALDLAELEAPEHPLFNLRGRIERNGWIEQAKSLVHPLTLYGKG